MNCPEIEPGPLWLEAKGYPSDNYEYYKPFPKRLNKEIPNCMAP
jgi:hypothetical protein